MPSIPVDVLRAFVAVVEARGFTRAAEELGRSQPTISLQVKRLEELVEAPLFDKSARFELTPVGAVCFDYGKRLLRLHDDMLDEASRCKAPDAMLRVGVASEFAGRLAPTLGQLRSDQTIGAAFQVVTDTSHSLAAAFRQNTLDIAFVVGAESEALAVARWRAPLGWFGGAGAQLTKAPLPLAIAPQGSALHEAAIEALRTQGRKFEFVCVSADFAVLAGAASAGLGVAPMIEGLAPEWLKPSADKSLPALPSVTLCLLARSPALEAAGRRWLGDVIESLQAL
jgi:DNA-binding transcriptional LysR family regulator